AISSGAVPRKSACAIRPLDLGFNPIITGAFGCHHKFAAKARLRVACLPHNPCAVDVLAFNLYTDGVWLSDLKLLRCDDPRVGRFPRLVFRWRQSSQKGKARETSRLVEVHEFADDVPAIAPAIVHRIWGSAAFVIGIIHGAQLTFVDFRILRGGGEPTNRDATRRDAPLIGERELVHNVALA